MSLTITILLQLINNYFIADLRLEFFLVLKKTFFFETEMSLK